MAPLCLFYSKYGRAPEEYSLAPPYNVCIGLAETHFKEAIYNEPKNQDQKQPEV